MGINVECFVCSDDRYWLWGTNACPVCKVYVVDEEIKLGTEADLMLPDPDHQFRVTAKRILYSTEH